MALRLGSALLSALSLSLAAAVPGQFSPEAISALRSQEPQRAEAARASLMNLRSNLGLDADAAFEARTTRTDGFGQTHTHFAQTHQGVKVFGGGMITHMDARGRMLPSTDAAFRGIHLNTTPSIAPDEALATAHRALAPKGDYANAPNAELVIFPITTQVKTGKGEGALSYSNEVVRYALAYHVHTELENGTGETAHTDYMIDAHTGATIKTWNSLETGRPHGGGGGSTTGIAGTAAVGTGNSEYSGVVSLNTTLATAGGYALQDMTRGTGGTFGHNAVTDMAHSTSGNGTIYQGNTTDSWGDGQNYVSGSSTTATNGQTAGVDAAFGIQATWDMYKNVLGRNGIDNTGKASYLRVHYSTGYDNAFWSDTCFCMTFGDGSTFKELTSVDVAGHEMSHGVTATSVPGGLTYSGESGGLNEGNSDIMGTFVEFYDLGGGQAAGSTTIPNYTAITGTINTPGGTVPAANYLIGEQLETSSFAHPLRWMYKPSLDGTSADAWYSGVGSLNVHYSSGVANHFMFLLAHGSQIDAFSGNIQSPMVNGVTSITGIGNDHAARIWYRALTTYFTSGETYAQARTATLSAASDLYGATSTEYATVAKAWTAVNVN
ncbi:MAG TPA: M4 family metallopeptidase [Holophagaceae bacterium]|jgi:Zn-dependent metalloprotease|nr:M4 family metallopeptidase [Holophagaceae bacterium]